MLGYKGTAGGFGYDISASQSSNTVDLGMHDSLNASYGADTQTAFRFGDLIQKETDANLDLTYQLDLGMASALTVSGGGEYRKEQYTAEEGDLQSYGAGPYAVAASVVCGDGAGLGRVAPTGELTAVEVAAASGYAGTGPTYAGTESSAVMRLSGLEGDVTQTAQHRRHRPLRRATRIRQCKTV